MMRNIIKIAFRSIIRYKLHSIINIGGLAIGISVFTLIMIYIASDLNYDKYHENYDKIYQLSVFGELEVTAHRGYVMKQKFPEIDYMVRIDKFYGGGQNAYLKHSNSEGLIQFKDIIYADPDFFNMFTVKSIVGDLSEAIEAPYSLVLTESTAIKLFGNTDVLNKTIEFISGEGKVKDNFTITAVIEDAPNNSSIKYPAIASFSTLNDIQTAGIEVDQDHYNWGYQTFFTFQENVHLEDFVKKAHADYFKFACEKYNVDPKSEDANEITLKLIPLKEIQFYNNNKLQFLYLIVLIGLFIIIIAIINFVNLSLAKSSLRSKEIGLRKVAGSSRRNLIRQFIGEAIVITLISVTISIIITEIIKPIFNRMVGKELSIGYIEKPQILLIFLVGAIIIGILAGFYPAIILSKYNPVKTLKNELTTGKKGNTFKQILTVVQMTISLILLIGVLLISKQINYMKTKDIGFDNTNIIYFRSNNESINNKYDLFKEKILQNPEIQNVSRTGSEFGEAFHISDHEIINGVRVNYQAIVADPDFVKTMGLEIIKGRNYEWNKASDIGAMIVNETTVKEFGIDNIIGYPMSLLGEKQHIIGVYKDIHNKSFHEKITPSVIVNYPVMLHRVVIKLNEINKKKAIDHIEKVWNEMVPDVPFQYHFLEDKYDELYKTEEKFGLVIKFSALFSIIIACLGLFGMISFTSERRKKEIGIRKTNGASVLDILVLLNKGILKWIGIASLIACPIAYFAAKKWLQNFAYQTPVDLSVFIIAFIIILIVALLTVSVVVVRAAKTNPVECLRYE